MWVNLSVPIILGMSMNRSDKRKLEQFREICREQCDVALPSVDSPWDIPPFLDIPKIDNVPIPFDNTTKPMSIRPTQPSLSGDPRDNLKTMFPLKEPVGSSGFLGENTKAPDVIVDPNIIPPPVDEPPPVNPPPLPPPVTSECPTFHPSATIPGKMSQVDIVNAISQYTNSKGYRHDPDGIPWLNSGSWVPWDGITTINPCTSTKAQLMAFIFPPPGGVNTMRGIRELFYRVAPFADNQNPTVTEIENWNIEVIRHFRKLLGFSQSTHPVSNHKCTYLKAAWAEERARTNYWSTAYPEGTLNGPMGPCDIPFPPQHCGASFILNPSDQTPYLCPSTMAPCTAGGGAEGLSNINTDIPWSIKLSRIIGQYLNSDGIGAHTGPFVGREYFGSAWFMNGGNTSARTKWSGNLARTCP